MNNDSAADTQEIAQRSHKVLTAPNVLCAIRLFGSPILLAIALADAPLAFLGMFLFLMLTDWIDGKLAVALDQRSVLGARLDSWADAAMYGALLLGGLWLKWDVLWSDAYWLAAAVISYAVTTAAGYWKFGRWPSYHTRAAKTCWLFVTIGAVCLLADWTVWPLRIAAAAVALTNMEAVLITLTLPCWQANVPSLYHAWRIRTAALDAPQQNDSRQQDPPPGASP